MVAGKLATILIDIADGIDTTVREIRRRLATRRMGTGMTKRRKLGSEETKVKSQELSGEGFGGGEGFLG